MSGFSADWLRQREPFDTAAREAAAGPLQLAQWLASQRREGTLCRVIDLGCGTGANLRALAPRLGPAQQWLVVDHDRALLDCWPQALAEASTLTGHQVEPHGERLRLSGEGFDATIERRALDLSRDLEALPFDGATLVTASALLDLVSADWLQRLVAACRGARASVLFALSVDGRQAWQPADPSDALANTLFDAHQLRDKGFGQALGPQAAAAAADAFRTAGYAVQTAASDWWIDGRSDPAAQALQHALIDGIGNAAIEQEPGTADALRAWQGRRHALAGVATLRIGHLDLIATLS